MLWYHVIGLRIQQGYNGFFSAQVKKELSEGYGVTTSSGQFMPDSITSVVVT